MCILVNGDALIVRVAGEVNKNIAVGELKKIVVPLLKDVIYGNENVEYKVIMHVNLIINSKEYIYSKI